MEEEISRSTFCPLSEHLGGKSRSGKQNLPKQPALPFMLPLPQGCASLELGRNGHSLTGLSGRTIHTNSRRPSGRGGMCAGLGSGEHRGLVFPLPFAAGWPGQAADSLCAFLSRWSQQGSHPLLCVTCKDPDASLCKGPGIQWVLNKWWRSRSVGKDAGLVPGWLRLALDPGT